MCWEDGDFTIWETTWDTAASDTYIHILAWNGSTEPETEWRFIGIIPDIPEKPEPKRKSKWLDKKQKRYDK